MTKTLILMRGLPGSGKSRAARVENATVISTDDYFAAGAHYLFDVTKIGQAHAWNQRRCEGLIARDVDLIVVDNTNVCLWEMREYVRMGIEAGYTIKFRKPVTHWRANPDECARRNQHGVPVETIRNMLARWEHLPSDNGLPFAHDVPAVLAATR